ncbi:transketolase n-terminal section-related [Holotrichia oblita]|nr:transketolase n-terminal section-related [Holotrichia oblita]
MEKERNKQLKYIANDVRVGIIDAVYSAKSGHPGGSLSSADIFTYLYFEKMNIDPKNPDWEARDRFVLSKGHTTPGYYSALAHRGYFPVEDLKTFRHTDSYLQGHPDMKGIPGVDMSSGSLGQGVSVAAGIALSAKIRNKSYRIYALMGDGESQEGQIWEAAMFASHYKLDNLCLFLDLNGLQIDGKITDVMNPTPHDTKFEAFGWNVITVSAHDFEQLDNAAKAAETCKGKPTVIICNSVKGKDVSFMENQASWHGAAPNDAQYETAIADLKKVRAEI